MSALFYVLRKTIRNYLIQLTRKKALLIVYILFAALIVFNLINGASSTETGSFHADIRILYAIFAGIAILLIHFYITVGLKTGGTLFNMADVGLMFTAPISPRKMLIYGVFKQIWATLLAGIFLLFQIPNLRNFFSVTGVQCIPVFATFVLSMFLGQLLSIGIYAYTSKNPAGKKVVSLVLYALYILLAIWFLTCMGSSKSLLDALYKMIDSTAFTYFPVAGWNVAIMRGLLAKNWIMGGAGILFYLLSYGLILYLFTVRDVDYYEDVLLSTQIAVENKEKQKKGRSFEKKARRNLKVTEEESGIRRGKGGSVIFYRILLEKRRQNRIPFLDGTSFTTLLIVVFLWGIFYYYIPKNEMSDIPSGLIFYLLFGILTYIQMLFSMFGNMVEELKNPYLFLIPAPSMHKMIFVSMPAIVKAGIDGILAFGILVILTKKDFLLGVILALCYMTNQMVLLGLQVCYQRIFGGSMPRLIMVLFNLFLFVILLAAGIIVSVRVSGGLSEQRRFLGMIPYAINGVVVSLILFYLSRHVFDNSEMIQ